MDLTYLTALIRHILTAVGGFAVARGVTDSSTVETIIGGAIAVTGLAWSLFHKKALLAEQSASSTPPAKTP